MGSPHSRTLLASKRREVSMTSALKDRIIIKKEKYVHDERSQRHFIIKKENFVHDKCWTPKCKIQKDLVPIKLN
jgi:hypothetical protein